VDLAVVVVVVDSAADVAVAGSEVAAEADAVATTVTKRDTLLASAQRVTGVRTRTKCHQKYNWNVITS